eukprot:1147810-Pelagomonas_calceolata.AAC.1
MRRCLRLNMPPWWERSKLCSEDAPLNMDVDSPENPHNPQTDTKNLPQGMAAPDHYFQPSETQANTQERPDHIGCIRKRKNPHTNGSQSNLHGTPPNQGLSQNPTQSIIS